MEQGHAEKWDMKDCGAWCKGKHYGHKQKGCGSGGALYGLGIIGAAIYYIQTAGTFWMGVLGIIKAIFWPAMLIYKVFGMLHM